MYISGSIKRKVLNNYQEKVNSFDNDGMDFGEFYLSYEGELVYPPFDEDIERALFRKQEKYIADGEIKIVNILKNFKNIKLEKDILSNLKNMDRKFAFALYELFYTKITSGDFDKDRILKKFYDFTEYIKENSSKINQIDLEIMIMLYNYGMDYKLSSLRKSSDTIYPLYSESLYNSLDYKMQNIIKMGMFVISKRVSYLSKTINPGDEFSLPIYFLIKSDGIAYQFLEGVYNRELTNIDDILAYAKEKNVSKSLIRRF